VRFRRACAIAVLFVCHTAAAQEAAQWRDPSPHSIQFVTVDEGVRLEVLDWGGKGRSIVLLAGLGNTGHIFDEFAIKLSGPIMSTASLAEDMGPQAGLHPATLSSGCRMMS
jgi:hypothetical protein